MEAEAFFQNLTHIINLEKCQSLHLAFKGQEHQRVHFQSARFCYQILTMRPYPLLLDKHFSVDK